MAKIHNISNYKHTSTDVFFFDNNVWMFIFGAIANHQQQQQRLYSNFFSEIVAAKRTIVINSLVLSEFANTQLKLSFKAWSKIQKEHIKPDYKRDYVGKPHFKESVESVKIQINKILKVCEKFNDGFNAVSVDNIFSNFGTSDFNDAYYLELAYFNGWKIVTDDADFFKANTLDVEIITGNIK